MQSLKNILGDNIQYLKSVYNRLKTQTKRFSIFLVRDVLDYLDYEIELEQNLHTLSFNIINEFYHPKMPIIHESPKNKGINRPTVVLDIEDSIVYRFCIEQIEDIIINKTRQKNIRGGKKVCAIKNKEGKKEYYEKWFDDWMNYNQGIIKSLEHKKYVVSTDIASYFDNINILLLKDLLRSDVVENHEILNLLFYFLECTKIRNNYEVNTWNGLLQENIDCSRLLAYYFLSSHDERMRIFCNLNDAEYFRFVDDMTILVNSEVDGKKALKTLTESLRKLGLLSSIEKTAIFSSSELYNELLINENEQITQYENQIKKQLIKGSISPELLSEIENYYRIQKSQNDKKKNWSKILKRFFTLFTYSGSEILMSEIKSLIIQTPQLLESEKILKYLHRNSDSKMFGGVIEEIIDYLYSEENLYPMVETELLEILLTFKNSLFSQSITNRLIELGRDTFFKRSKSNLSEYARAIACLLLYKFDNNKSHIHEITTAYIKSQEHNNMLKKYMVFISLTDTNEKSRRCVLEKARLENDPSIKRFITFLENGDKYFKMDLVKKYLKAKPLTIIYDEQMKYTYCVQIEEIRKIILKELLTIYRADT